MAERNKKLGLLIVKELVDKKDVIGLILCKMNRQTIKTLYDDI